MQRKTLKHYHAIPGNRYRYKPLARSLKILRDFKNTTILKENMISRRLRGLRQNSSVSWRGFPETAHFMLISGYFDYYWFWGGGGVGGLVVCSWIEYILISILMPVNQNS